MILWKIVCWILYAIPMLVSLIVAFVAGVLQRLGYAIVWIGDKLWDVSWFLLPPGMRAKARRPDRESRPR